MIVETVCILTNYQLEKQFVLFCRIKEEEGNPPRPTPFQSSPKAGPLAIITPLCPLIYIPFHQAMLGPGRKWGVFVLLFWAF